MTRIEKEYEICYAHRLLNHEGKCSRLHGHNARIKITLEGPVTKDSSKSSDGMVMDFGDMDRLGAWLDTNLDHRTILEVGDPIINALTECGDSASLVIIDMPPTAELLGAFIHNHIVEWLTVFKTKFKASVTFWETPKACAIVDDSSDYFSIPVRCLEDDLGKKEYVSAE